jgi:hypothetical protein
MFGLRAESAPNADCSADIDHAHAIAAKMSGVLLCIKWDENSDASGSAELRSTDITNSSDRNETDRAATANIRSALQPVKLFQLNTWTHGPPSQTTPQSPRLRLALKADGLLVLHPAGNEEACRLLRRTGARSARCRQRRRGGPASRARTEEQWKRMNAGVRFQTLKKWLDWDLDPVHTQYPCYRFRHSSCIECSRATGTTA